MDPITPAPVEGWKPRTVAAVRGIAEAAAFALTALAVEVLSDPDALGRTIYASAAVAVIRTVEGVLDERIDPTRQRAGGGAPAA